MAILIRLPLGAPNCVNPADFGSDIACLAAALRVTMLVMYQMGSMPSSNSCVLCSCLLDDLQLQPATIQEPLILDLLCRDLYDFFYLPVDFKNRCNLGYAFANFPNPADTVRCYEHFHGSHWEEFNSKKVGFAAVVDANESQSSPQHDKPSCLASSP